MLVGGVVVENDVDDLACRNVSLKGVEEADELLMPGRCMFRPKTSPVRTFNAANSVVVPCRL